MIFDEESAGDAQKILAPPKRMILQKQIDAKKKSQKNGRRLKSCLAQKALQKHKPYCLPLRQGS